MGAATKSRTTRIPNPNPLIVFYRSGVAQAFPNTLKHIKRYYSQCFSVARSHRQGGAAWPRIQERRGVPSAQPASWRCPRRRPSQNISRPTNLLSPSHQQQRKQRHQQQRKQRHQQQRKHRHQIQPNWWRRSARCSRSCRQDGGHRTEGVALAFPYGAWPLAAHRRHEPKQRHQRQRH